MFEFIKAKKFFFIYYLFIAIYTLTLTRVNIEYSSMERFVYLCVILLPTIICVRLLPFVVIVFWGFSRCSFTPLFPSTIIIELAMIMLIVMMNTKKISNRIDKWLIIFCLLYFVFSDLLHYTEQDTIWPVVIATIMVSTCIQNKEDVRLSVWAFLIMSFLLSILYLSHYQEFMAMYSLEENIERSSWKNPNEFAFNISCGFAAGIWLIFYKEESEPKIFRYFIYSVLSFMTVVLIMIASRGAIISAGLCFIIFLFASKQSMYIRLLVLTVFAILIYILYTNSYFELLFYRLADSENDVTAGHRTIIWVKKIHYLFQQDSISQLFGLGIDGCDNASVKIKTHNDFVTALVAHGVVGLTLFITFITAPLRYAQSDNRFQVAVLWIYLFFVCCFLEPLFRGYLSFIIFYMIIYKMAIVENKYRFYSLKA